MRRLRGARAAMDGANAAVVGILLAALWNPVARKGIRNVGDALLAGVLCALLFYARAPVWLLVPCAASAEWAREAL